MISVISRFFFAQFLLAGLITTSVYAGYIDDFKKHARSIYLLHSIDVQKDPSIEKTGAIVNNKATKRFHEKPDSSLINMLSYIPEQSFLLPVHDIDKIVTNIEALTKKIETTKEGEESQQIRFDMAYEYFLLYLHYMNEKYSLVRKTGTAVQGDEIPVRNKELEDYLKLSEYYLKSFVRDSEGSVDTIVQGKAILRVKDDVSFRFRNMPDLYLNAYFLAMMLECEKLGGEWGDTSQSIRLSAFYDRKTWLWLDTLWKNRFKTGNIRGGYSLSSRNLLTFYELYMRYHFFGRYIRNFSENDPLLDSQTRTLIYRLTELQKELKLPHHDFYSCYSDESIRDSNNTDFIINLYLARRGFATTKLSNLSIPENELFELYRQLYDDAARSIKYNIPYRSIIYNELVLYGISVDNLHLMENTLYSYARMSMRIQENENNDDGSIRNSSRLTMAYLLASILDRKRSSGLDQNSDEYGETAESLTPLLISEKTDYWEYASVIHSSLATFYSRKENSESLAMYHAKRSFMIPCEKTALNYDSKPDGWKNFFSLNGAVSYLKLFTDFQKKYQTSPDAAVPAEYKADLILQHYLNMKK